MKKAIPILLSIGLIGCSTHPDKIKPKYISANKYKAYSCQEINEELLAIGSAVEEVTGEQKKAATVDAVSMGVGFVVFWPALFLLATTDDQKEELARLKGEHEALQAAATEKKCGPPARS